MNNNININNESENYDKYILRRVKIKFPHIRKHKYSDEYCLSLFKLMLNDFVNWPSLKEAKKYMDEAPDYHYKYLNSVFNKWSNENIFEDAYLDMLNDKYFQLEHIKNTNEIPIFIDCSFINNMNGINCKASNPEYRKKKCTKISAISDSKNNIISLTYDKTHLSKNNIPSFTHDINLVQENLDNMLIKLPREKNCKLCGDKGYITQKKFKLNNKKKIKIIAPKRKNQKTKI